MFRHFDWPLFIIVLFILLAGIAIQYSLSLNQPASLFFLKHCLFVGLGLVLFFLACFLDFRRLKPAVYLFYLATLFLLLFVLFFGQSFRGVRGWLGFGSFSFQVAELAKLALILVLAKFWSEKAREHLSFSSVILNGLMVLPAIILIAKQPDLGSALLLVVFWLAMILLVDRKISHFIIIILILTILVVFGWNFFLKDYQKARLITLIKPQSDPLGAGYQLRQSVVAVGSGQFWGRGLGLGPQSQLKFLPAIHTDFVFAGLSEELGFVGSGLILALFFTLLARLVRIARRTYDSFGLFIVLGAGVALFIQLMANIGMNLGILPIIGIPLPLVSYGGSSMLIWLLILGLVQSVTRHQPEGVV